jgi:anti-sigma-K factor RskA
MTRKLSPETAEALAGEYVLGTLRGPARRRFEAMMREDAALAETARRWEGLLTPLAEQVPPVEPPRRVWREIEARIDAAAGIPARRKAPAAESARTSLWGNLSFWRGFALVSGGLASVLLATFLYLSTGPRGEPLFVAVLQEPVANGPVRTVVSMHSPNLLRVRMVKPWAEARDRSIELWILPTEGAPRSLGTVGNAVGDTMIDIASTDPRVKGAQAMALTVEPRGGSPTGKPTGPVLAKGIIAPVKRT